MDSTTIDDSFADMTLEELYERLKPIARAHMLGQDPAHTLGRGGTALLNTYFAKVNRYFPALATSADARRTVALQASKAMARLLQDHAKGKARLKRGGGAERVSLHLVDGAGKATRDAIDVVALNIALEELDGTDPRGAELVALRYFGGFTMAEIATQWKMSPDQVAAVWDKTKVWLAKHLSDQTTQREEPA